MPWHLSQIVAGHVVVVQVKAALVLLTQLNQHGFTKIHTLSFPITLDLKWVKITRNKSSYAWQNGVENAEISIILFKRVEKSNMNL